MAMEAERYAVLQKLQNLGIVAMTDPKQAMVQAAKEVASGEIGTEELQSLVKFIGLVGPLAPGTMRPLYAGGPAGMLVNDAEVSVHENGELDVFCSLCPDFLAPWKMIAPQTKYIEPGSEAYLKAKMDMEARNRPVYEHFYRQDPHVRPHIPRKRKVYVVGNGPSLALAKDFLPDQGAPDIGIITVNGALSVVDITPTFHVVIEPQAKMEWFDGLLPGRIQETELVMDVCAHSGLLELGWKEVWFSNVAGDLPSGKYAAEHCPHLLRLHHGESVSFTGIHLATMMDPDVIVLLGMDSCFTDGELHPGEPEPDNVQKITAKDVFTGQEVKTTLSLRGIARHMMGAMAITMHVHPNIRFVNASGRGILGGKYMTVDGKDMSIDTVSLEEADRL